MNDVTHKVTDGLLGGFAESGEGVHIKVGASYIPTKEAVVITGGRSLEYIRKQLGLSPLADAVMDSIEYGAAKIFCIPILPDVPGTITQGSDIVSENSGSVTLIGMPSNSFRVVVQMTGKGGLNVAAFRYSLNGGYSFSDELSVPLSGKYEIPDTGLALGFQLSEGQEYEIGDIYQWTTTAPQLTNERIIAGIHRIRNLKQEAELVHIVGSTTADTWAAIAAQQAELMTEKHKPLMFVLEAYAKNDDETMEAYLESLEQARKAVKNYELQVVVTRALYVGMDNVARDCNVAGIICGLYAKVGVHKSIGETAAVSLSEEKILRLLPEGIIDDDIEELDRMGYLTLRQYDGLAGYYVNNARMLGPDNTDYPYAEDVRTLNKIIRETRKKALLELQSDVDLDNPEADLQAKVAFIKSALDVMIEAQEISSADIIIPDGVADKLAHTGTLSLQVRYRQRGIIRNIEIDLGKQNPYAT